jgi:dTDP-D-glucose 4,6-dehydratase
MCDYSPQSVLVTGGAGFIGSSVLAHLVHEYSCSRFICVDKLDYCSSIKNLQEVWSKSNFQFVKVVLPPCVSALLSSRETSLLLT